MTDRAAKFTRLPIRLVRNRPSLCSNSWRMPLEFLLLRDFALSTRLLYASCMSTQSCSAFSNV